MAVNLSVDQDDLLTWRAEWLEANDPGDGTDCVTPFDHYLYGSKIGSADGFPMQPVVVAELGVVRFKENRIVNYLIECISSTRLVLNEIAKADFTDDERMQFAQLLGYSVCGYCDLSYASEETKERASELAAALVGGAE